MHNSSRISGKVEVEMLLRCVRIALLVVYAFHGVEGCIYVRVTHPGVSEVARGTTEPSYTSGRDILVGKATPLERSIVCRFGEASKQSASKTQAKELSGVPIL
jgi:hypothetical protein